MASMSPSSYKWSTPLWIETMTFGGSLAPSLPFSLPLCKATKYQHRKSVQQSLMFLLVQIFVPAPSMHTPQECKWILEWKIAWQQYLSNRPNECKGEKTKQARTVKPLKLGIRTCRNASPFLRSTSQSDDATGNRTRIRGGIPKIYLKETEVNNK